MNTSCRQEARYRIARGIRTIAGMEVDQKNEDSFVAVGVNGSFELTIMPGNRRVLISQHSFIRPECRGMGHGQRYLQAREEIARYAGCNLMLATVREDNAIEIHLLEKHGWKRFNTRDTGVSLWGKEL